MKRDFWDKVAADYDATINRKYEEANRKLIQRVAVYCDKSANLLDIGCGTGCITVELAKKVHRVEAVDPSEKMLEIARHTARMSHIDDVEWKHGDLFDEKAVTGEYDIITAFNVLMYVKDQDLFIAECYKHLVNGGYFMMVTDCLEEATAVKKLMYKFGLVLGKLDIIPKYQMFRAQEVNETIRKGQFKILMSENIYTTPPNYLVIAQK